MSIQPSWAHYCVTGCLWTDRGIFWASTFESARSIAAKWGGRVWKL